MGCVEGGGKTGADGTQVSAPSKKVKGTQDVEAPEVFQTTDSALWDGRPSLGGIWVAAPDVATPERALIFNPATGKSVTGALFKRERDNPGPRLQLSSDAAEALGILAGQPTEIRVTAVRKAEVAEPAPAEVPAPTEGEAAPAGDTAAIAAAALDAVDAGKTDPAAAPADPAAVPADGSAESAATAAAAGTVAALAPDATPKKKTWKERRAEAKAAREAKKRAAAEAKAA
ncbi:MAG TPA: SPOR domain-containing protein, partial [Tabrizicola sp.]|nr:SPOR domain-containing protein [Tabrizicola sp.]